MYIVKYTNYYLGIVRCCLVKVNIKYTYKNEGNFGENYESSKK